MSSITYGEAMAEAHMRHRTTVDDNDDWSCSCGASTSRLNAGRLRPVTRPMAEAHARRHVSAAAMRILKAQD